MADFEHCFGCRKSVYVSNIRPRKLPCADKVCLYCFEFHKYLRKGVHSNSLCFKPEDKRNPSTLTELDALDDYKKYLSGHDFTNTLR